jgi:Sporulation and spore germination
VISRAQRILFIAMLIAAVTMAAILIRLRERAHDRLQALQDEAPVTEQTSSSSNESIALLIPNDTDGSLIETRRSLPMPQDESARAKVLIETLLHLFREPKSTHPIAPPGSQDEITANNNNAAVNQLSAVAPGGGGSRDLDEIFLMPIPQPKGLPPAKGQMAVVDFSAAFAASHPSGIEPETLTLLAILGTLHDNLPDVTQVRFLVDGHEKDTLAGHADLTRVYVASDTATGSQ